MMKQLVEKRFEYRKQIAVKLSLNRLSEAMKPCRLLSLISQKIFNQNEEKGVYDFLADQMLLTKCLILQDFVKQAREVLLYTKGVLDLYIKDERIDYKKVKKLIPNPGKLTQFVEKHGKDED